MGADCADLNNDGQASVYECFLHAARQTSAFYETNGLLATESALIDDNGDGRGSELELLVRFETSTNRIVDGDYSRLWSLVLNEDEMKLTPDQRRRRNVLERQILELSRKRTEYADESQFYAVTEPILLEIARIYTENEASPEPEPKPAVEAETPPVENGDEEQVESPVVTPGESPEP